MFSARHAALPVHPRNMVCFYAAISGVRRIVVGILVDFNVVSVLRLVVAESAKERSPPGTVPFVRDDPLGLLRCDRGWFR